VSAHGRRVIITVINRLYLQHSNLSFTRQTDLTLGTNTNVSGDRQVWLIGRPLYAQVRQRILAKYRPGIEICCHEATVTMQRL